MNAAGRQRQPVCSMRRGRKVGKSMRRFTASDMRRPLLAANTGGSLPPRQDTCPVQRCRHSERRHDGCYHCMRKLQPAPCPLSSKMKPLRTRENRCCGVVQSPTWKKTHDETRAIKTKLSPSSAANNKTHRGTATIRQRRAQSNKEENMKHLIDE